MEEWKDIEGFEGFYMVSNHGRIKRLATEFECGSRWGSKRIIRFKEKILNTTHLCGSGYSFASLSRQGLIKRPMVHRAVANAFLPKVDGKNTINHKDGNKLNNHVSNLEWVSNRENSLHSYHILGNNKVGQKKIINKETGVVYNSITEAVKDCKYKYSTLSRKLAGTLINDTNFEYAEIYN